MEKAIALSRYGQEKILVIGASGLDRVRNSPRTAENLWKRQCDCLGSAQANSLLRERAPM